MYKIIQLKDNHPFIYSKAVEYLNDPNVNFNLKKIRSDEEYICDAFDWTKTEEGYDIWVGISKTLDADSFYKFHQMNKLIDLKKSLSNLEILINELKK